MRATSLDDARGWRCLRSCWWLAGCGSNLAPESQRQAADGGTVVTGEDGVVVPGAADPGVADPGAPGGDLPGTEPDAADPGVPAGDDPVVPGPGGATAPPDEENAPAGDEEAGSCDGFENSTGITDDKIVIGNASDVSGPVPGLFESVPARGAGLRRVLQRERRRRSAAASSRSTPTTAAPTPRPTSRPTPRAAPTPSPWWARCRASTPAAPRRPRTAACPTSARSR